MLKFASFLKYKEIKTYIKKSGTKNQEEFEV